MFWAGIFLTSLHEENLFFPSLGLFRHVGEQYELYKALVWGSGVDLLFKHVQKSLSQKNRTGSSRKWKEIQRSHSNSGKLRRWQFSHSD